MKKLPLMQLTAVMSVLVPAMAGAQTLPVPPAPATLPTPAVVPTLPTPARLAMPVVIPELSEAYLIDTQALREQSRELANQLRVMSEQDARAIAEDARRQAAEVRLSNEQVREIADQARREAERVRSLTGTTMAYAYNFDQVASAGFGQSSGMAQTMSADSERSFYERGQNALSQRQYEQAVTRFDQVIAIKGTRTDAALYWKAFAQFKMGRSNDANATLNELQKSHKDSKYTSDAKALEAEIKRMSGQPARPENEDDEDLKLLALQGLINSDPERAIPLVQGVLASAGSLKLKDRALYVLAISNSPQAHTILVNTAKNGTPDLQNIAIQRLRGSKTTSAEFMDIYNGSQNDDVKRSIIRALGSMGDRAALVNVVSGTTVMDLRREAVSQLGSAQGQTELWTIYQRESNKELKQQILSTLGSMGAYDRVIEVAKSEKDVEIRNRAIRSLGSMKAERSGQALIDIYGTLDVDGKKSVISGLANQNNAEGLIAVARKESSLDLKMDVVRRLGSMKGNKAAQDYLAEIIK